MQTEDVKLVIVGSLGIDTIETPVTRREDVLGGSLTYACAAASFFVRTGMVGVVGTDFPEAFMAVYDHFGIDREGLQQVEGKTFRWSGVYEADMINRRTLATELNVFESFNPALPPRYRGAPYLMLGNIAPELQLRVLEQMDAPRFVLADTMDLWINIAREPLMEVIGRVDMLTLNDTEARLLTGEVNAVRAARSLLEAGPRYIALKKGEHGAMLFSREGTAIIPAYPLEAFEDPTGAGDTFAGGFMGALAGRDELGLGPIRDALLVGSTVAAFGVERFSLERLQELERREIMARLDELRSMVSHAQGA